MDDWKMVMPSTPVKVKPMKSKPAARPRLRCSVLPSRNMSRNGTRTARASRLRSRRNLTRSRVAIAALALSSCIGQEPRVHILEACLPRPHHRERCRERAHQLVRRPALAGAPERPVLVEARGEPDEPAPERFAVCGVDLQPRTAQLSRELSGRPL